MKTISSELDVLSGRVVKLIDAGLCIRAEDRNRQSNSPVKVWSYESEHILPGGHDKRKEILSPNTSPILDCGVV